MLYLFVFLLLAIFSFLEVTIRKDAEFLIIYILFGVLLVAFAGLRYKTGYDYESYQTIFDTVNFSNYQDLLVEPGSALIIVILNALHFNFAVYLTIYALLGISLKLNFFRQYSPYIFASFLVYYPIGFLINEFGQVRHGLAVAIVLVAFSQLFQNKPKRFFILAAIAMLFHLSAFIVLPVYFFVNKRVNALYLVISLVVLSVFLFFDSRPFLLSILGNVPIPAMQAKMTFYLYSDEFGKPLGLNLSLLLRVATFLILLYFADTGQERYKFYQQVIWLYYYGIVLYIVFNSVSDFAIRSSLYFKTLDCIILPFFVSFGKTKKEKCLVLGLVIFYSFYSLFKLLSDPVTSPDFIPYKTIFNKGA